MQRYYDSSVVRFLNLSRKQALQILKHEARFEIGKTRFYYEGQTYPLELFCFEHPKNLGLFDPDGWKIGLNRNLILKDNEKLCGDVLRHELAHLICFLYYGGCVQDHGQEFRDICRSLNWGADIFGATTAPSQMFSITSKHKQTQKWRKLLALGQSQNRHEAQLAMEKASQYFYEHGLHIEEDHHDEEGIVVAVAYYAKRKNGICSALQNILKQFCVYPVLSYNTKGVCLEVTGKKHHVEYALYLSETLVRDFHNLWEQQKKDHPSLRGISHKNAFLQGLAQGICEAQARLKSSLDPQTSREIAIIQDELDRKIAWAYGRLGKVKSQHRINANSFELGRRSAQEVSIQSPLSEAKTEAKKASKFLLPSCS